VARRSGVGSTFNVTSVMTPRVPWLPVSSLQRSRPVTFFSTRPPERMTSPVPLTARMPSTWSRIAPHATRRGPDRLAATTPPTVCVAALPSRAEKSGGSAVTCCPFAATAAVRSAIGVPDRTETTSSAGE
jgi:hypothetical protein